MNSLTVKPSFFPKFYAHFSPFSSCCWPRLGRSSSVGFSLKTKSFARRLALRLHAYDSSKSDTSNGNNGDSKPPNGTLVNFFVAHFFYYAMFLLRIFFILWFGLLCKIAFMTAAGQLQFMCAWIKEMLQCL